MNLPYLVFGTANAKLKGLQSRLSKRVFTFSLLSGHTCPYARDCESRAMYQENGKWKIVDGTHTEFRCFSASEEVIYPNVRESRINNMQLIEAAAVDINKALEIIAVNFPAKCEVLRIHVGGDFKTQAYFDTWVEYARRNPSVLFYAYTKSLPFWIKRANDIPENFMLTASRGGYKDELIKTHNLREAIVINPALGNHKIIDAHHASVDDVVYEIDHDDYHAASKGGSFALVLHGIQPAGTAAAAGLKSLKGFGSYNQVSGANTTYV
jgi:hypothetical protein